MTAPTVNLFALLDNAARDLERAMAELDAGRPARGLVRNALANVRAARRMVRLRGAS